MRRSMTSAGIAILGVTFMVAACDTQQNDVALSDDTEGYATEQAEELAPEEPIAGEEGAARELELDAQNDSGISGQAQIAPMADGLHATVTLDGVSAADSYTAHIHRGTCDEDLGPVTALEPFTAGATGAVESVTMLEPTTLTPGEDYTLRIVGTGDASVACGSVPELEADETPIR